MMRLLCALLLLSTSVSVRAATNCNLYFNFSDFTLQPTAVTKATLTPLRAWVSYNGSVLSATPVSRTTSTNGEITFTNVVSGYDYRITLFLPGGLTSSFTNGIPSDVSGTTNGGGLIGVRVGDVFYYAQATSSSSGSGGSATNVVVAPTDATIDVTTNTPGSSYSLRVKPGATLNVTSTNVSGTLTNDTTGNAATATLSTSSTSATTATTANNVTSGITNAWSLSASNYAYAATNDMPQLVASNGMRLTLAGSTLFLEATNSGGAGEVSLAQLVAATNHSLTLSTNAIFAQGQVYTNSFYPSNNPAGYIAAAAAAAQIRTNNAFVPIVNVANFGATNLGRYLVGNVTSNSTAVILTIGTVSAGDVGGLIRVTQGTSTNQDLVTTIATVTDSTHFDLTRAVSNTITSADIFTSKRDESGAIQLAINSVETNGGTIYFPPGLYWVTNLYVHDVDSAANTMGRTLTFLGHSSPTYAGIFGSKFIVPSGVSGLVCGLEVGNGTNTGIIDCGNSATLNGIKVEVVKLLLRLPSNPNMNGVYANNSQNLSLLDWVIETGYGQYDPRTPEPTYPNNYGVWAPRNGNYGGGTSYAKNGLVGGGLWGGIRHSDHFLIENVALYSLKKGIVPVRSAGSDIVYLDFEGVVDPIDGTHSDTECEYFALGMRVENTQAGWWYSRTLVNDPGSNLNGWFPYRSNDPLTNNGALDCTFIDILRRRTTHGTFQDSWGSLRLGVDAVAGYGTFLNEATSKGFYFSGTNSGSMQQTFSLLVGSAIPTGSGSAAARWATLTVNPSLGAIQLTASGNENAPMNVDLNPSDFGGVKKGFTVHSNYNATLWNGSLVVSNNIISSNGVFRGNGLGLTNNTALADLGPHSLVGSNAAAAMIAALAPGGGDVTTAQLNSASNALVRQYISLKRINGAASAVKTASALTNYATALVSSATYFAHDLAGGYITNIQAGVYHVWFTIGHANGTVGTSSGQLQTNNVSIAQPVGTYVDVSRGAILDFGLLELPANCATRFRFDTCQFDTMTSTNFNFNMVKQ